MCVEQLREREVADQCLGELEESVGVLFAPIRLLPGRLQVGDHPGHDQHHRPRRRPRRSSSVPTGRSACRRAGGRRCRRAGTRPPRPPRPETNPPTTTPTMTGTTKTRAGIGDGEVGPERQHEEQERGQPDKGHNGADGSSPVRSVGGQHASHHVRHNFHRHFHHLYPSVPTPFVVPDP